MSDATQIPTDGDVAALFAEQIKTEDAIEPVVDDTEEIVDDTEQDSIDAEPDEDLETDNLEPTITAPVGMTADEQAVFAQADPELQQFLVNQEAHRRTKLTSETERLAEQRRQLEAQQSEVAQQRDQYAQFLQAVAQQELKPPPATLAAEDPDAYAVERAKYEEARDQRDLAVAEQARLQTEREAQAQRDMEAHQASVARELPNHIPAAADPAKAKAIETELSAYALSRGIPEAALSRATAQEKAILYESMQFRKGAAKRKAPPRSQRPGTGKRPGDKRKARADTVRQAAEKSVKEQNLTSIWAATLESERK